MINFYHQVPSVYNSASRDFQYLSWLINIVLNSVKHNVDDLYDLPNTKADPRLTELLAMTLGFKVKRNYDQKQLIALVSIIPYLLKYKGTQKAIELAGNALIKASGARGVFKTDTPTNNCLEVQLPADLVDTVLFTDVLPYILPAGLTVRVVTKTVLEAPDRVTDLDYADIPLAKWVPDAEMDLDTGLVQGIATLFKDSTFGSETDPVVPEFTNFKLDDPDVVNTGLLDNSIIPDMATEIKEIRSGAVQTPPATAESEETD